MMVEGCSPFTVEGVVEGHTPFTVVVYLDSWEVIVSQWYVLGGGGVSPDGRTS